MSGDVFKALADESRRNLLDRLRQNDGQTLGVLCAELDMTRQAVSKHLAILENANLVVSRFQGRRKYHFLNPVPLQEIADRWIAPYRQLEAQVLIRIKQQLESQNDNEDQQ